MKHYLTRNLRVAVVAIVAAPLLIFAYEQPTHSQISIWAYEVSHLDDFFLSDGLMISGFAGGNSPPEQFKAPASFELKSIEDPRNPKEVFAYGAAAEDDDLKFLNHFYNLQQGGLPLSSLNKISPDWALEDTDEYRLNDFSYRDFKEYLWDALFEFDFEERAEKFYMAFRALGHVAHHIQDMAQPQHVRGDVHCSNFICGAASYPTGYHYEPSIYEHLSFEVVNEGKYYDIDRNGSLAYPVRLPRIRDYWARQDVPSSVDYGIARFSSENFVTDETNFALKFSGELFSDPDQPLPAAAAATYSQVPANNEYWYPNSFLEEPVRVIKVPINDPYRQISNQLSVDHAVVSALPGLLGVISPNESVRQVTATRFSKQRQLIPRAIGYTAGFINRVFNGSIDIETPDDGIIAIKDHGSISDISTAFPMLRFKVTNRTNDIQAGGQTYEQPFKDGELYFVASYRPNYCYEKSLKGHLHNGNRIPRCENPPPEEDQVFQFAVSKPIEVISWSKGESRILDIDFSDDPIPLNATSLYISAYYRGGIGDDPDTFGIGGFDMAEPSYLTIINSTDYYFHDDYWYDVNNADSVARLFDDIESGGGSTDGLRYEEEDIYVDKISLNGTEISANASTVPPGSYARVVYLADSQGYGEYTRFDWSFELGGSDYKIRLVSPFWDQRYREALRVDPLDQIRGVSVLQSVSVFAESEGSSADYLDLYNIPNIKDPVAVPLSLDLSAWE